MLEWMYSKVLIYLRVASLMIVGGSTYLPNACSIYCFFPIALLMRIIDNLEAVLMSVGLDLRVSLLHTQNDQLFLGYWHKGVSIHSKFQYSVEKTSFQSSYNLHALTMQYISSIFHSCTQISHTLSQMRHEDVDSRRSGFFFLISLLEPKIWQMSAGINLSFSR